MTHNGLKDFLDGLTDDQKNTLGVFNQVITEIIGSDDTVSETELRDAYDVLQGDGPKNLRPAVWHVLFLPLLPALIQNQELLRELTSLSKKAMKEVEYRRRVATEPGKVGQTDGIFILLTAAFYSFLVVAYEPPYSLKTPMFKTVKAVGLVFPLGWQVMRWIINTINRQEQQKGVLLVDSIAFIQAWTGFLVLVFRILATIKSKLKGERSGIGFSRFNIADAGAAGVVSCVTLCELPSYKYSVSFILSLFTIMALRYIDPEITVHFEASRALFSSETLTRKMLTKVANRNTRLLTKSERLLSDETVAAIVRFIEINTYAYAIFLISDLFPMVFPESMIETLIKIGDKDFLVGWGATGYFLYFHLRAFYKYCLKNIDGTNFRIPTTGPIQLPYELVEEFPYEAVYFAILLYRSPYMPTNYKGQLHNPRLINLLMTFAPFALPAENQRLSLLAFRTLPVAPLGMKQANINTIISHKGLRDSIDELVKLSASGVLRNGNAVWLGSADDPLALPQGRGVYYAETLQRLNILIYHEIVTFEEKGTLGDSWSWNFLQAIFTMYRHTKSDPKPRSNAVNTNIYYRVSVEQQADNKRGDTLFGNATNYRFTNYQVTATDKSQLEPNLHTKYTDWERATGLTNLALKKFTIQIVDPAEVTTILRHAGKDKLRMTIHNGETVKDKGKIDTKSILEARLVMTIRRMVHTCVLLKETPKPLNDVFPYDSDKERDLRVHRFIGVTALFIISYFGQTYTEHAHTDLFYKAMNFNIPWTADIQQHFNDIWSTDKKSQFSFLCIPNYTTDMEKMNVFSQYIHDPKATTIPPAMTVKKT